MPSYSLTTFDNSINSSVEVTDPGGYTNPDDNPNAPASIFFLTISFIAFNSSSVAGRSSDPNTQARTFPCGIKNAKFAEIPPLFSISSK